MHLICLTRLTNLYQNESYSVNISNKMAEAGGRLNKKDGLTRYGNSHVKDMQQWELAVYLIGGKQLIIYSGWWFCGCSSGCGEVSQIRVSS